MCQWGSQRWGTGKNGAGNVVTTARDWRCILNHYYNANSNSIRVDPSQTGVVGTGLRTTFLRNHPTYGSVAYDAYNRQGIRTGIRTAKAADGSDDSLLVSEPAAQASWAPEGTKLVYIRENGLSVINADGSGNSTVTTTSGVDQFGNPIVDFSPSWSPLGTKIAFCSNRGGTGIDVWTVNPDGTALLRLTTGLLSSSYFAQYPQDCYLSWSPDGAKIAFTGQTVNAQYTSVWDVYVMNANGSGVTKLTSCQAPQNQTLCVEPSWSPNGRVIAFVDADYQGDNIGGGGIYVMNSDGTGVSPVYQSSAYVLLYPHWSTDGAKILFTSNQSGDWGLWSMNVDGSGQVQIVDGRHGVPQGHIDCSRCPPFDQ
jgi:Tol biopolymer transport system component